MGGLKDLIQRKSEERHAMIGVHPEGCVYRSGLGILKLNEIVQKN
ncbi:MAG: hypothetical protein AEth_00925 [Candidatus Argoarchaeum ethanivorans]|uniref:Uncharacterized protein n=1 Tax=Candidatus Argoarchaeum ethanivorans TaxID=2608793 RepID=A0A8B3S454_9EURY|nr:MAG: hypothetical protein AEth_00925 [Candidatus Argoarchaeum ethanivorans]